MLSTYRKPTSCASTDYNPNSHHIISSFRHIHPNPINCKPQTSLYPHNPPRLIRQHQPSQPHLHLRKHQSHHPPESPKPIIAVDTTAHLRSPLRALQLRQSLEKYQCLQRVNMESMIDNARSELDSLWSKCYTSVDHQTRFYTESATSAGKC